MPGEAQSSLFVHQQPQILVEGQSQSGCFSRVELVQRLNRIADGQYSLLLHQAKQFLIPIYPLWITRIARLYFILDSRWDNDRKKAKQIGEYIRSMA